MLLIYQDFNWTNNKKDSHVTFGGHLGSHIENTKNVYKQLFNAKIDGHSSISSIKHQDLFRYIVSSEINQNIAVLGLNAFRMSSHWTCFWYFWLSRNLMTFQFPCIFHSCAEHCVDLHIWYWYVPLTFWIKEQGFASLITVKNRQLSTVPVNFDCSRVWQWTVNSTTVAFGSESVNM